MILRLWASAAISFIALLLAALVWSVGPASECSAAQGPAWLEGLAFFALSVACGAYVIATGESRQRLAMFISFAVVVAGYVWGLAQSLPSVYATEIACAADGARPLR